MRLFTSGIRKLIRRPASYVSIGLLIGLMALIFIATGATARQATAQQGGQAALLAVTFPTAYSLILSFILGLGGFFALIYGAAIAGSEWTWGTLKSAVARGEGRTYYQVTLFAAVVVMIGIAILVATVAGVVAVLIGATLAGVSTSGISDARTLGTMPELLGRTWLAVVEEGALGFAIATLARSQLAGIGGGIAFYFGALFSTIFLPDVVKYLPFQAANAVVQVSDEGFGGGNGGAVSSLDPNTAVLVVAAWLVGSLVVTALFTERAEISG